GLNWGLVGLSQFDLAKVMLESIPLLQNAVNVLVGLSTVYMIYCPMNE
ncbi:MAG TPA: DUF378 domain-containing protein, partial [Candidatus Kapabacteria bacterium]|nr:DUF378 domain-containing protein [Candidatus Kapabacteria bacterium]